MTDTAPIFSASYSDWRIVKGRKVVQIIFEVPIGAEGHAYRVLGGMPKLDKPSWFGIARLKEKPEDNAP